MFLMDQIGSCHFIEGNLVTNSALLFSSLIIGFREKYIKISYIYEGT